MLFYSGHVYVCAYEYARAHAHVIVLKMNAKSKVALWLH